MRGAFPQIRESKGDARPNGEPRSTRLELGDEETLKNLETTQGQMNGFFDSTPIQMPPLGGGICGRLTQDLPLGCLQDGKLERCLAGGTPLEVLT